MALAQIDKVSRAASVKSVASELKTPTAETNNGWIEAEPKAATPADANNGWIEADTKDATADTDNDWTEAKSTDNDTPSVTLPPAALNIEDTVSALENDVADLASVAKSDVSSHQASWIVAGESVEDIEATNAAEAAGKTSESAAPNEAMESTNEDVGTETALSALTKLALTDAPRFPVAPVKLRVVNTPIKTPSVFPVPLGPRIGRATSNVDDSDHLVGGMFIHSLHSHCLCSILTFHRYGHSFSHCRARWSPSRLPLCQQRPVSDVRRQA